MKKLLAMILVLTLAVACVACGGSESSPAPADDTAVTPVATDAPVAAPAANPVQDVLTPATSAATGAYATITVSKDVQMDDSSAWLGLCPAGKDYVTELEADEVDVIWFNYEWREEGDPYVFACDFSSVEDGTYALVVATSDDENVGYVAIQLEMTKSGDSLSFDYSNAKLNERP